MNTRVVGYRRGDWNGPIRSSKGETIDFYLIEEVVCNGHYIVWDGIYKTESEAQASAELRKQMRLK